MMRIFSPKYTVNRSNRKTEGGTPLRRSSGSDLWFTVTELEFEESKILTLFYLNTINIYWVRVHKQYGRVLSDSVHKCRYLRI